MKNSLGETIKTRRKSLGHTQKTLAKALGVSSTTVVFWERDENTPNAKHILALASILKMAPDELLEGSRQNTEKGVKEAAPTYTLENLTPELQELIHKFLQAPPELRRGLLRFLEE